MIPAADAVYQDGDIVHLVIPRARFADVVRILDAPPPAH